MKITLFLFFGKDSVIPHLPYEKQNRKKITETKEPKSLKRFWDFFKFYIGFIGIWITVKRLLQTYTYHKTSLISFHE